MADNMEVFLFSLPSGMKKAIESKAAAMGCSKGEVIRLCLASSLRNLPPAVNPLTLAKSFDELDAALARKDFQAAAEAKQKLWVAVCEG